MTSGKPVNELRVYVDSSGGIWFGDGKGKAKSSNVSATEFAASDICQNADKIRLLGLPSNATLIEELCARGTANDDLARVEIGTPLFCRTLQQTTPDEVISGMERLDGISPSLGGWHKASAHDAIIYRLIRAVVYGGVSREKLLEAHPAYPAISFLPGFSRPDAEFLLALIGDPRWYIDLSRPGRTAKLRSYLGLRTPILLHVWDGIPDDKEQFGTTIYRTWHLVDTWTGGKREAPGLPALDRPNNFLWRRFCEFEDPIRGAMRASALFVSFLREVWLDAISPQELFVPEYFFSRTGPEVAAVDQDGSVAQAYREHRQQQMKA